MSTEPHSTTTEAETGSARVELIFQWKPNGDWTKWEEGQSTPALPDENCTWVHARMPTIDPQGKKAKKASWKEAADFLDECGLEVPKAEHRSGLGSPLSDKPGVYTALGASVVTAEDNRSGNRDVIRLSRIALVPVGDRQLISARHRDGLDWLESPEPDQEETLRDVALLVRDPYGTASLLNNLQASGRVTEATSSEELAVEIVLATTEGYPRAVLDSFSTIFSRAEEPSANFIPASDDEAKQRGATAAALLRLITAVSRLEREIRRASDDFDLRVQAARLESPSVTATRSNFARTLESLGRIRADARTTVGMIGNMLSSAHLQISRQEAKAASEQRALEREDAEHRHTAEQRLARAAALLASVLLIPTLVAAVFGADVTLPREGSVWQTWLMLATMVGLGSLSFALLREFDQARDAPSPFFKILPYGIAGIALGAAVVIALVILGTG